MRLTRQILCLVTVFVPAASSHALNIEIDYAHDTFIAGHSEAKAALEAAAGELSQLITTRLTAIDMTVDPTFGTWGETVMTLDWFFGYNNPSTLETVFIEEVELARDEVRIFVGGANHGGDILAIGGPAAVGVQAFASGPPDDWARAVQITEAFANDAYSRGGGPVLTTLSDNPTYEGVPGEYSVELGVTYATLTIDMDRDNNGVTDSAAELENAWHFNHLTSVPGDKYDFYSVMIHEMAHALGFGTSQTWEQTTNGDSWNGSEVAEILGSGDAVLDSPGHIREFTMSTRVTDGSPQEAMMDPNIRTGVRKGTTLLDLAFLRDLGFETAIERGSLGDFTNDGVLDVDDLDALMTELANGDGNLQYDVNGDGSVNDFDVFIMLDRAADQNGLDRPYFPGDINLDGAVDALDLNKLGINWTRSTIGWSNGDLVPDGVIDARDLNVLGQNWLKTNAAPVASSVPESGNGSVYLATVLLFAVIRRTL